MSTIGQRSWLFSSILELSPVEWVINQYHEILINALRKGPTPRHVAFIMDGNRRYAKQHRIESIEGHHLGYEALYRVLNLCYKVGIEDVTIYAFSMENFHRSKYEVDGLMDLMKAKFREIASHGDLMEAHNIKIAVLGRRDMLRQDVLDVIDDVVLKSAKNATKTLNICVAYTARDEMTTAAKETVAQYSRPIDPADLERPESNKNRHGFSENHITQSIQRESMRASGHDHDHDHDSKEEKKTSHIHELESAASDFLHDHGLDFLSHHDNHDSHDHDHDHNNKHTQTTSTKGNLPQPKPTYNSAETITASTISSHMSTSASPPIDILIRTSNVQRLSDFMLWQCHEHTDIVFLKVLWPECDIWSIVPVLAEWQWKVRKQGANSHHKYKRRGTAGLACTQDERSHLHMD